ncbi:SDR family oxidoreductase [Tenacibaculum xiamenense]|uniref:SDR family oxidoreductase n=1 Tax=Tenacibaculum xiamenense TaxID=1261553 RepID=UPI0038962116
MSKIKNKGLIVITGASSGIGAETAKLFSKHGHPLLLIARRLSKLKELNLSNTIYKKADVSNLQELREAINYAENIYGPTDCIINNAGVMLLGDVTDQDPEEWRKMFEVNVFGVLNGIQAVLPKMKKQKKGTIINISSIAGKKTFANHAVYGGTKFGVQGITENIREEVCKYNIRTMSIAPGAVETELLSHTSSSEIIENYEQWKTNMGGVLNPIDVANSIWFAYAQPQHINIREIVLATTKQEV